MTTSQFDIFAPLNTQVQRSGSPQQVDLTQLVKVAAAQAKQELRAELEQTRVKQSKRAMIKQSAASIVNAAHELGQLETYLALAKMSEAQIVTAVQNAQRRAAEVAAFRQKISEETEEMGEQLADGEELSEQSAEAILEAAAEDPEVAAEVANAAGAEISPAQVEQIADAIAEVANAEAAAGGPTKASADRTREIQGYLGTLPDAAAQALVARGYRKAGIA